MQPRKITPPQSDTNSATTVLLVGVLVGILMIVIGIVAAGRDDVETGPTPTFVPAPLFGDGTALTPDAQVYTTQAVAFSSIAAAENENPEQLLEACTPVQVSTSAGDYFYLDSTVNPNIYWVYATVTDERGWNGWLPMLAVSNRLPESCTTPEG